MTLLILQAFVLITGTAVMDKGDVLQMAVPWSGVQDEGELSLQDPPAGTWHAELDGRGPWKDGLVELKTPSSAASEGTFI